MSFTRDSRLLITGRDDDEDDDGTIPTSHVAFSSIFSCTTDMNPNASTITAPSGGDKLIKSIL
jgi:hypothetical protein